MLSHIAKLIWNRKRANSLIITEVAITFMVLFAITAMAIYNYQKFYEPLGFEWKNTWTAAIKTGARWNNETDSVQLNEIVQALRQRPEIESVGLSLMPIFENSSWNSREDINGQSVYHMVNFVNQSGPKDWGVELIAGRWFGQQDDGQNYTPVMLSQRFVELAFKDIDPVNFEYVDEESSDNKPKRVVGVFKEFRQQGEFGDLVPYLFYRYQLDIGNDIGIQNINLTFNQPKTAIYEETLLKTLKGIAPNWEFDIQTWSHQRDQQIKLVLIPMMIMLVVVGFLLVMVSMGLFGVLFQNISRRTQEIGLRRAIGASEKSIQSQIIGELVAVALFAMSISFLILLQIPLLQLIEAVSWNVFWLSLSASVSLILMIVILCAVYPSKVAIKLPPALALHYE